MLMAADLTDEDRAIANATARVEAIKARRRLTDELAEALRVSLDDLSAEHEAWARLEGTPCTEEYHHSQGCPLRDRIRRYRTLLARYDAEVKHG